MVQEMIGLLPNNYSKKIPRMYQFSKNISVNQIVRVT